MHWTGRPIRAAISTFVSLALTGCGAGTMIEKTVGGSGPKLGTAAELSGYLGAAAGDEPRAVRVAQQILNQNGSAADAAVAMGFALAVTLPSRAGLGGGGACLVYDPAAPQGSGPEAIMFIPRAPAVKAGDRPAAVPMLARGLFALQSRHGALPIAQDIAPAEQLARLGVAVSAPLAADLAVVAPALLADREAARIFGPRGAPLIEGDLLVQRDLGSSLAALRVNGARDMYTGTLATILAGRSAGAGGPITVADLVDATPTLAAPITLTAGKDQISFLPPAADGGLAAAVAFQRLQTAPDDTATAQAYALGAASAWRKGGDPDTILAATSPQTNTVGALPASTSFVTLDRTGGAVACALTMGNLFGTGRMLPETGLLLAASPAVVPSPLLAAAIAWNRSQRAFRAEVAGSGQEGAALGVAFGMARTLKSKAAMPSTVPSPGRINAIACPKYLPGDASTCTQATDPRGGGAAVGSG